MNKLNEITSIFSNICVISISIWLVVKYFVLKNIFLNIKKNMEDDIDNIIKMADTPIDTNTLIDDDPSPMRERLIGITAGGKAKEYLGKNITSSEIENLDEKEITKLYARYEAYMGGLITKTIKKHVITAYTNAVKVLLPTRFKIENVDQLNDSLNEGPFIELALSKYTCQFYHQFGHFMAPLEALLLTSNHVTTELPNVEEVKLNSIVDEILK
jgi:hypothetical protein